MPVSLFIFFLAHLSSCCQVLFGAALLDIQNEKWFCTRCNVSHYPNRGEKVKRANKLENLDTVAIKSRP